MAHCQLRSEPYPRTRRSLKLQGRAGPYSQVDPLTIESMPELPEVETIARGVNARVRGDQIVEAWFGSHREPFKNSPARQAKGLEGRTILEVHRAGKHIVC